MEKRKFPEDGSSRIYTIFRACHDIRQTERLAILELAQTETQGLKACSTQFIYESAVNAHGQLLTAGNQSKQPKCDIPAAALSISQGARSGCAADASATCAAPVAGNQAH